MKLYKRLILLAPFVLLTIYFLRHWLRTEGCNGAVEVFTYFILLFLFILALSLCLIAINKKSKKPEKVSLIITLLTLLTLVSFTIIGDKFYGRRWITAKSFNDRHEISRQTIVLRKNKTFRIDLIEADYSCFFSGTYRIINDTLELGKEIVQQTDKKFTSRYLIKDSLIVPVNEGKKSMELYDTLLIER